MRLHWLALPVAILAAGCSSLNTAATYRDAAKQLKFTLDRVEPSLQVALPIEQSRLGLRLTLGAENPTNVHFQAKSITGGISLDEDGASHFIGQLAFARGVDLLPASRTPLVVDLSFTYGDIQKAWVALRDASMGIRPATWRLDGQVRLDALGIELSLPLRLQRHVSGQ